MDENLCFGRKYHNIFIIYFNLIIYIAIDITGHLGLIYIYIYLIRFQMIIVDKITNYSYFLT